MGSAAEVMSQIEIDKDENFTPQQIEKFKSDPDFYRNFVKAIEKEEGKNFGVVSS